ncbi:MAG: hypothetical protein CL878_10875 [Dehalococcoidia bacterium]|nr:hypothetical protein [Dehalococcoidia bacterium]
MAETHFIAAPTLEAYATDLLVAVGTPAATARHVAEHMVLASLSGHDSHGVIRMPYYIDSVENGSYAAADQPTVAHTSGAISVVDGANTFGQLTASFGLEVALKHAARHGIGAVALRRCTHVGRLGHYPEVAAERGYISMLTVGYAGPGVGGMAPFGGTQRQLGTNPWALGIPVEGQPSIIADFATTVVAEGKLKVARAKGAPLPPGYIVDAEGNPSTNAHDFYAGGMLLPFGGHKGYAMALIAALLGAGLTADEPITTGHGDGVFVMALDPAAFGPQDAATPTLTAMLESVKAVPPAAGFSEVLLPGEPERRSRDERRHTGIPMPAQTWGELRELAQRLGVTVPEIS